MLDTSARLLRLLSLLQAHQEWAGPELAGRLGVTARTVRRDVDRLRALGYPVHASPGTGGGYRLGAGARLPPLLLDDEEAVAVAVGLRTAAGQAVEGIADASVRALAKLEQVLPERLRDRVGTLNAYTVPLARGAGAGAVDPGLLSELARLCRDGELLRFTYQDHHQVASRRTAEPHRLVCSDRRWYLVAWDTDRADWRTFRVDRLVPKPPHGPRRPPRTPPAEDLAAYVGRGISSRSHAERAVLRLLVPRQEAAAALWPGAGEVEAETPTTCLLRTGASGLDALVVHVVLLGFAFEVLEPAGLTDRIRLARDRLDAALERGNREDGAHEEGRVPVSPPALPALPDKSE
ncbi:helix-turn-helix transcriptional regulator [Streptomyces sp. NPDC007088]|uniref:helix-turn-helix transcriptional regulator n=1 Tax=Streptomyces sp. NPDC007088 TaxID=3364773 RepID=UPI0036A8B362